MLAVALGFGLVTGFETLQGLEIIILTCVALVSLIIDYSAGALGAKIGGASKRSIAYGLIGLLLGTFLFPPFGGIIAMFLTIALIEYGTHNSQEKAVKAAGATLLGAVAGSIINGLIAITFVILFIIFAKG